MKKRNYDLLKSWLDENWKRCSIIMFNCKKEKGQITSWMKKENITKQAEGGFFLQNHLDSFLEDK